MSLQPIGAAAFLGNTTGQLVSSAAPSSSSASPSGVKPSAGDGGNVAGTQSAVPAQKPTDQQIQHALSDLQKAVAPQTDGLEFSYDKASGRDVVKIVDTAGNKVIRQFPSEEALSMAQSIGNPKSGLLINQKV